MTTVMVVWTIYMIAGFVQWMFMGREPPNPALWGVPGAVWLALNPPTIGFSKKEEEPKREG